MRVSGYWMPNQSLQATPVGAGLEAVSRRPGVPELDRYTKSSHVFRRVPTTWRIERPKGSAFGGRMPDSMADVLGGMAILELVALESLSCEDSPSSESRVSDGIV